MSSTVTEVINPATEEVLRTVERLGLDAVDDAVARATAAQKRWAAAALSVFASRICR